jgi:N-acetylglucosaminyl-diphospho-decaprenol L-rhamnosyltransferase
MTADRQSSQPILDVAFIVYNYTTKLLLKKQLDFFGKSELSFSYSLTVVDDASLDGSRELVQTYPGVAPVFLESCQGFGRAVNRGLAAAPESRYVCLLQTDVNLAAEALESLVRHCDAHRDVKVCAPVISFPWGQPQKFVFNPSLLTMYSGSIDKFLSKSVARRLRSSLQPVRVAGIIGPFLFCSRELVVDHRLYDEGFRHYFCDMELAHRLMRQGVVCEVLPHCSLVRLGGQTSFIRDPEMYFSMKYAYVNRFYGRMHARMSLRRDILRARFKVFSYGIFNRIAPSGKLSFQIERYGKLTDTLEKVHSHEAFFPDDTR